MKYLLTSLEYAVIFQYQYTIVCLVQSYLYIPSAQKCHKVEIEVNEWVFPKGGVAFVWVLRSEMTQNFLKLMIEAASARP